MAISNFIKGIYIVITTESEKKNAYKIANLLLRDKLIPCIAFKNIESYFWWEGEIKKSNEIQLIIKCKKENVNEVCQKISENHSYAVPEIISFPVSTNSAYHDWVFSL